MMDTSQHCIMVVNQSATTGTDITQALERANYRVAGPFKQCSDASDWLAGDTADGALLDMLLSDDTCFELARDLRTVDALLHPIELALHSVLRLLRGRHGVALERLQPAVDPVKLDTRIAAEPVDGLAIQCFRRSGWYQSVSLLTRQDQPGSPARSQLPHGRGASR